MKTLPIILGSVMTTALIAGQAQAASITYTGSDTYRNASATFDNSTTGELHITLSNNTSSSSAIAAEGGSATKYSAKSVLLGLFFNTGSSSSGLSLTSATLGSGSSVFTNATTATSPANVNKGWGYTTNPNGGVYSSNFGITAAGYGLTGGGNPGKAIDGTNLQGSDYGLAPTGSLSSANSSVKYNIIKGTSSSTVNLTVKGFTKKMGLKPRPLGRL